MDDFKVYRGLTWINRKLVDPLKEDITLIDSYNQASYLMNNYGITWIELWNIVHGFEKDALHYCSECGKLMRFSKLARGPMCTSACSLARAHKNDKEFSKQFSDRLNSASSQAKGRFTQFMSKGAPDDPGVFYLAIDYDRIHYKFGVTCKPGLRFSFKDPYLSYHVIIKDTRLYIGSLERDLKIYLNQNNEYFLPDQFESIKSFIRSYKLVNNE